MVMNMAFGDFGEFNVGTGAGAAGSAAGLGMAVAQGNTAGIAKSSLGVVQSGMSILSISTPITMAIGMVVGVLLSYMFNGATEKKQRTLEGTLEFQSTTIRLLENGTSLYPSLDVNYLARLEQLTRPDELKSYFADPGALTWNDKIWQVYAFYVPIAECISVKTCISDGIIDFNSYVKSVLSGNPGSAEQTIMIKAADYLSSKGLPYPYPWDMARLMQGSHPGFTVFDYLGYIRVKSQIGDETITPGHAVATVVNKIPSTSGGGTMAIPNGTLMRNPSGSGEVDIVWNGQKRTIESLDIFNALGLDTTNIHDVDANTWASVPYGANITDAAQFHQEMASGSQQASFLPDLGSVAGIPITYILLGGLVAGFLIKRKG